MLSFRCWWQRKCQGEWQWVAIQAENVGDWTTDNIVIVFQLEVDLMKVEDVEDWRSAGGVKERWNRPPARMDRRCLSKQCRKLVDDS